MTLKEAGENKGYKVDTEVKYKQTLPKGSFEFKLTPSKVKLEKSCVPDMVNSDGKKGSFLGRFEHKIGSDKPDLTAGFSYAIPKINDDVGIWTEGNVTYKGLKSWVGDISALVGFRNQFFVGSQITGDLQTRKSQEITGIVGANVDGNFVYFGANCLNHLVKVGFTTKKISYFSTLAAEAEVDLNQKGPIQDRTTSKVAVEYAGNSSTTMKVKFDITKKLLGHFTMKHKINDNLTLTMTDSVNPIGFFKNAGKEKYNLGLALEANF